jgi:lipopolysaccharide transport system permease protein
MMAGYKYKLGVNALWLPLFLLLVVITSLGIGLWLSAMNVQFRDVRYLIPFITQFWLFITPIAYPSSLLPESIRPLYGLNPMAGAIEGFRWALLGVETKPGPIIAVSALTALVLLVSGALYFRRTEKIFADVV